MAKFPKDHRHGRPNGDRFADGHRVERSIGSDGQRFLLADRIERILLDILEMLIEAVYAKERRPILLKVNLKLDALRFMMRLAFDMKYVSVAQYDFFAQSVLEVGRMAGGWMKAAVKEEVRV